MNNNYNYTVVETMLDIDFLKRAIRSHIKNLEDNEYPSGNGYIDDILEAELKQSKETLDKLDNLNDI